MITASDLLPVSTGRTLHVARTGSDGFPGTPEKPWKTLPWAMRHVQPGDIVRVGPGDYPEPWPADVASGTPVATITFTAATPDARPVIRTFPYWRGATSYLRYNGFVWDGKGITSPAGDAALVFGGSSVGGPCHHIEISDFALRDFANPGRHAHGFLRKEGAHHIDILNGTVERIGLPEQGRHFHQHGVYFGAGHHTRVMGVLFKDIVAGYGLHWWGSGEDDVAQHNTIDSTFAAGATLGSPTTGPNGVVLTDNAFRRTCIGKDSHAITNWSAKGSGTVIARNTADRSTLFDPRLNAGSTRAGAGPLTQPAAVGAVGYEAFVMPDVITPPDPCALLRAEHEQLQAEHARTVEYVGRLRAWAATIPKEAA